MRWMVKSKTQKFILDVGHAGTEIERAFLLVFHYFPFF